MLYIIIFKIELSNSMIVYKKNWVIGAIVVLLSLVVIRCTSYENKTTKNVENCERVTQDMTTEQVIEIMGKPNDIKTYNAKINYKDLEVTKYYYDAPSGSSVGVDVFFDAKTNKVVRTECKD